MLFVGTVFSAYLFRSYKEDEGLDGDVSFAEHE